MAILIQDLKYGARTLYRNPGFTLIALFTLALGIGANTAIFSVVKAVLLNPLPYASPERLVMLWENDTLEGNDRNSVAPANFADWKQQNQVCTELAFYGQPGGINVSGRDEPERITGAGVSGNIFSLLGATPIVGSNFTPVQGKGDAAQEVILSFGLWQRRFGGDPSVVGQSITLEGRLFTIVGVMPSRFRLPEDSEIWFQTRNGELPVRGRHFLRALGRLRPGVALEQARADFATIAGRLEQQYPDTNRGRGISVISFDEQFTGKVRRELGVIFAAVVCVLLIAISNVSNLLLVRAAKRKSELAIRAALGASRSRLVRQLLSESLMLALAGGAMSLLLAWWLVSLLSTLSTVRNLTPDTVKLDAAVIGFSFAIAVLTGVVCGLIPAWQTTQPNLQATLKEGGRTAGDRRRGYRLRNLLVVSEMALSVVLLVGALLLIRSFARLLSVEPGFDPHNVLTMQLSLSSLKYDSGAKIASNYRQLVERVAALPGVVAVGAINRMPLAGDRSTAGMRVEGREERPGESFEVHYRVVTPGYFRVLRIPLLAGAELREEESRDMPGVVMINQLAARRFWPNEDAVGRRIKLGPDASVPWLTIRGVVSDAHNFGLDAEARPEVYVHYQQNPDPRMRLAIRTEVPPYNVAAGVRQAVRSVDPDLPVAQVITLEEMLDKSVAQRRLNMWLLGVFAGLALFLSGLGIYAVSSYAMAQRTHELGIRIALGAEVRDVLKLALGEAMKVALIGLGIGMLAALALARVIDKLLFGVSATDPLTFVVVLFVLLFVALAASFVPAWRAANVDPMIALRCE